MTVGACPSTVYMTLSLMLKGFYPSMLFTMDISYDKSAAFGLSVVEFAAFIFNVIYFCTAN